MKIQGQPTRSIWDVPGPRPAVGIIDQTRLPHAVVRLTLDRADQLTDAIRHMQVRGAPLIGVAGAYALALALHDDAGDAALARAHAVINEARPTAVNLRWALDRVRERVQSLPAAKRAAVAWAEAGRIAAEDVEINRAIGGHGAALIRARHQALGRPVNVLTHCNAGWIACVDYGTALSAIYTAHDAGVPLHVWVDETRPRNQGLLTAWELAAHGVPHTLIADNAGGHLMQRGQVDLAIVGADRVSRQGDVCNKIGTYLKALAAHDSGVPFYAAVPSPTIDWSLDDALREIPIEDRAGDELRVVHGLDTQGAPAQVRIAGAATPVANPAFDVTPARLVTGIITERGVAAPGQLHALFGRTDAPVSRAA
ncbi:MAG: S-methyl-5-thioribose-1-phosphate isomerase [Burkholderiaceae bacterium]|jgi:methylthioribose-1-phosphate isomerase|nr:S-methyl-5-thioribose-1-phosphate isomerase [Burkholderiaceae bacterium]